MQNFKLHIIFIAIIFLPGVVVGQHDTILQRYKNEFKKYKEQELLRQKQYIKREDSLFIAFLEKEWKEYPVYFKTKKPKPKPDEQPVIQHPEGISPALKKLERRLDSITSEQNSENTNIPDKKEKGESPPSLNAISFSPGSVNFYGDESYLIHPSFQLPDFESITKENIGKYYELFLKIPDFTTFIDLLHQKKNEYRLNDWGHLKFVRAVAETYTTIPKEQVLFSWALLLNCGYDVKIGFNNNDIYLLAAFDREIFFRYCIDQDGVDYYFLSDVVDAETIKSMALYRKGANQGKSKISLYLRMLPQLNSPSFNNELVCQNNTFSISLDKGLLDFYNDYPFCNLETYFSTPLSDKTIQQLDAIFKPLFNGLNTADKIRVLLLFVQQSFEYQNDILQFGQERFLFPDETLFYPFSDCEDRAILFSQLIIHYTNLSCIALNFPNHVSVAVNIPDWSAGLKYSYNGSEYVVCDPTFINADIGVLPAEFFNIKPEIIPIRY